MQNLALVISNDFKVDQRISLERIKILKIKQVFDLPQFIQHLAKKVW